MWLLTINALRLIGRYSHYGLVLLLWPMLMLLGPICMVLVMHPGKGFLLAWGGIFLVLWQMATSNAMIFWSRRSLDGRVAGWWRCLYPQKGWFVVFMQNTLMMIMLQIPMMLIDIDDPARASLIVIGCAVTFCLAIWLMIRLVLVPVLVGGYGLGWSAWRKSWQISAGHRQISILGALVPVLGLCQTGAVMMMALQDPHGVANPLDLIILPCVQIILVLVAFYWPLAVATEFCRSMPGSSLAVPRRQDPHLST